MKEAEDWGVALNSYSVLTMDLTPQDRSLLSVTNLLSRLKMSILDKRTELGTGAIRLLVGRDKQPELVITITETGRVFYE